MKTFALAVHFESALAGRRLAVAAAFLAAGLVATAEVAPTPTELRVDFAQSRGKLRALHGVNNGPKPINWFGSRPDVSNYFREAAIPSARLHDVPIDGSPVVDMPIVFPLGQADPAEPENYVFGRTDDYIQAIVATGADVVYRLGTSIEHTKRKYDVHPPKDFGRWATACVNIIRHYNNGWANGFQYGFRYWEIWNEPDTGAYMWTGTPEQFDELYSVTARAIKRHDPTLKVGPGLSGHPDFVERFLAHCRDQKVPLDFFVWHTYGDAPIRIKKHADEMRATLDRFGFQKTEGLVTEWHYFRGDGPRMRLDMDYRETLFNELNGPKGAAFNVAVLLMFQDTTITMAHNYTTDVWGLFDWKGHPKKTYFAMKAFGQLLQTPHRVACIGSREDRGLVIGAGLARDRKSAQVLLTNFDDAGRQYRLRLEHLPWTSGTRAEILAVDADHNLEPIRTETVAGGGALEVACPAPTVLLIRLTPAERP